MEKEFYLTISDDDSIDRSYHAVLKDHPEIFWVHNREKIYKTTYSDSDYCVFTPGYTYTDGEIDEIQMAMEQSFQEVRALIPEDAGDYEKVRIVYTYVIDHTQYQTGEDDQSIAGVFWKNLQSVPDMQELSSIFWKGWIFPVFMWTEAQKEVQRVMHGIL